VEAVVSEVTLEELQTNMLETQQAQGQMIRERNERITFLESQARELKAELEVERKTIEMQRKDREAMIEKAARELTKQAYDRAREEERVEKRGLRLERDQAREELARLQRKYETVKQRNGELKALLEEQG
jgi:3-methyladenine DNA glycosylase AlkD